MTTSVLWCSSVDDGGGGHGVAVEDGAPFLRLGVGGDDGRAFLVAFRAHLEERLGAAVVERQARDMTGFDGELSRQVSDS